jgi:transient receptor potential cation channel subfamily C protein 4
MTTLFWALFGLTQLNAVRDGPMQEFTKRVGEHLLMVYHAMAIIVLINMLIAMMSNSFQNIEVYF